MVLTNAEKYLKEGATDRDFAKGLAKYISNSERMITDEEILRAEILYFLTEQAKPTLTDDERTILRNIEDFIVIGRREDGRLYCDCNTGNGLGYFFDFYNHLFKFIESGEEYSIEELLKGE